MRSYFNLGKPIAAGDKVLDFGCLYMNNLTPFADESFDFLLSINTSHYKDNGDNVMAGLRKSARVGKPDCHFLNSTAAPTHYFVRTAERLGPNRYRLKTGEFRDDQVMGYFDGADHLRGALEQVFGQVEIAEITERYPRLDLGFYVAKCSKA